MQLETKMQHVKHQDELRAKRQEMETQQAKHQDAVQ